MTRQRNWGLDRRAVMRSAILLVGGAWVGLPDIGFAHVAAPAAPFFAAPERALLDAVCATMIPRTDTPGALEAGVPAFIDGMMTRWADDETRGRIRTALADIDA